MYAQWRIYKIVGAVGIVLVSFWATLQLLESFERRDPWATLAVQRGPEVPRPSGSLAERRDLDLFDPSGSKIDNLHVVRSAATAPDGTQSAMLLEDKSGGYASIFHDFPVKNDDLVHTVAVDVKPGSSPLLQMVMQFLGGRPQVYYAYIDTKTMKATGEGQIWSAEIGKGWYRFALSGANNRSGNTTLRIQIYPRHGQPGDTGSIYIANARLDP